MDVPAFIQQCLDKKGQIAIAEVREPAKPDTIKQEIAKPEPAPVIPEQVRVAAQPPTGIKQNLPADYEQILHESIEFQFKADSVTDIMNNQKKELNKLSESEKSVLKTKILQNEKI